MAVNGPGPQGYDLSFDIAGNVYLTGLFAGSLWLTSLNPSTGDIVYSRLLSTTQSEVILDGNSDPIVGHRVGNIYRDKIAISAMTTGDLTQAGSFNARIIVAQLPIDGSITGTFTNITIADITGYIVSSTYVNPVSYTHLTLPTKRIV